MKFYTNVTVSGNNILLKEIDNGIRSKRRVSYEPTLYAKTKRDTGWKTLQGESVEPIPFGSIKECRNFLKDNDGMELYGNTMFPYAFIGDTYTDHELQYDLNQISIVSLDIETESEGGFTQNASETTIERINLITVKDFRQDQYHVFCFLDGKIYNKSNRFIPKTNNVSLNEFSSEKEMLLGFLKFWRKFDPDIITGWNVRFFDIPYIYNRLLLLFDEETAKRLSPWGIVNSTTVNFMNMDRPAYDIYGMSQLDYYQIYRKNVLEPRESYTLDHIAKVELDEGKLDWREKYESMREFYTKDFQLFAEYNIQDVRLPNMLETKLKLIELVVSVAYLAKVNYVDVLAQTRTWDMLIFNWLKEEQIVIPQKDFKEKSDQFAGAYVKEPKPGLYNWAISFDVASLYPNIIRALNIGPETKTSFNVKSNYEKMYTVEDMLNGSENFLSVISHCLEQNITLAANGVTYSKKTQSFFSRMVEILFTNRKKYQAEVKTAKKELENCSDSVRKTELQNTISKFDVKQKSTKIMMNSLYGAFGNEFFRFFDIENAEAVTLTGQFIIQFIQKELNGYLNKMFKTTNFDYVVYSDTDSVYVVLDKLVDHVYRDKVKPEIEQVIKFLDKVCHDKLEPLIDTYFTEITQNQINGMVADKPILSMKREVIADRGIWGSKKHYILNVWNSEGDNYFECNVCHNKFSGPSEKAPPCNKDSCKSTDTKRVAKLKIMGFDMVKSSLPQFTKDAMRKAVNLVMTADNNDLADFISKTRSEFMKLPAETVAFPRGANNLDKWSEDQEDIQKNSLWDTPGSDTYKSGTPKAVKGVLLYNQRLKDLNLQGKYPPIGTSEKIKYVHLKEPNPIHDKVISFQGKLPVEFGLHKYIDYVDMFEMTMIKPLEKILDPIGWSTERQHDMDKFFK